MKKGRGDNPEKEMIRRKFSRAAEDYELYARIQKKCASYLLEDLPAGFVPGSILEIGCGTGNYSRLLKEKFPDAALTALDFSEEMLNTAREKTSDISISFLQREAEEYLAYEHEKFDLITSNATLQWFKDLPRALGNMAGMLEEKGLVQVSVFGSGSLADLGEALREIVDSSLVLPSERFPDFYFLQEASSTYFNNLEIKEINYEQCYRSFLDLLRQIRHTGTGGFMERTPCLTRGVISELDNYLSRKSAAQSQSSGYTARYQVFFLTASEPR